MVLQILYYVQDYWEGIQLLNANKNLTETTLQRFIRINIFDHINLKSAKNSTEFASLQEGIMK